MEKYAAALERLKTEDSAIAGKPLREAVVDADLTAVRARLNDEVPVVEKNDPPPFTFPQGWRKLALGCRVWGAGYSFGDSWGDQARELSCAARFL